MKRDLATAEALIEVPAPLLFNLVDRVLDLTTPRIEFSATLASTRLDDQAPPTGADYAGGVYAGVTLDEGGEPMRLVLMPGDEEDLDWEDAKTWAAAQGSVLPSRIDALLLFQRLKDRFQPSYYWTAEPYSDPSYAWMQYFSGGYQTYDRTSGEGRARAVRRVPIR